MNYIRISYDICLNIIRKAGDVEITTRKHFPFQEKLRRFPGDLAEKTQRQRKENDFYIVYIFCFKVKILMLESPGKRKLRL